MRFFYKKPCIFKAFVQNPCFVRLHLCTKGNFYWLFSSLFGNWDLFQLGPLDNWDLQAIGNWDVWAIGTFGNWDLWTIGDFWIILDQKDAYTVRPRDTRPWAARTLQVHVFELGPKKFGVLLESGPLKRVVLGSSAQIATSTHVILLPLFLLLLR